jgi:hypothetical protein
MTPEEERRQSRRLARALSLAFAALTRRLRRLGLGRVLGTPAPARDLTTTVATAWAPEAQTLQRTLTRVLLDGVILGGGPRLDPLGDAAVTWARTQSARLVREITDQQRIALQQVITRAMAGELTVRSAAHALTETVGLTARQEAAVAAYRRGLLARDVALPAARIEALTDQFRDRVRRTRAVLIARTETIAAFNAGKLADAQQGVMAGDPLVRKKWVTAADERRCAVCRDLEGVTKRLDEPFTSSRGWIGQHPPAHSSCRCTISIVRASGIRAA